MHLGLDLLFEKYFSAFENFVNMRPQLARFRIDDRELLFDAESKRMFLRTHGRGRNVPQKQRAVEGNDEINDEAQVTNDEGSPVPK
jgi:hypothetical protein